MQPCDLVVVNYNAGAFLNDCITSVFAQEVNRVVIVDNAWGICSRSRPIFVEWHKHRGMIRFYGKFFRAQYPGILAWAITLGVWLRFTLVASYHCARHLRRLFAGGISGSDR